MRENICHRMKRENNKDNVQYWMKGRRKVKKTRVDNEKIKKGREKDLGKRKSMVSDNVIGVWSEPTAIT